MPVTFVDRPMKTSGTADALMGLSAALRNFMEYRDDERNFKLRQEEMERRAEDSREARRFRDLQMSQYHQQMDDAAKLREEQDAEIRGALTTPDQTVKNEFATPNKPEGTSEPSGANTDELQNAPLDLQGALSGFIQPPQPQAATAPLAASVPTVPPMGAAFKTGIKAQAPLASMLKGPQVPGATSTFTPPSEVTIKGEGPTGPLTAEQRVQGKKALESQKFERELGQKRKLEVASGDKIEVTEQMKAEDPRFADLPVGTLVPSTAFVRQPVTPKVDKITDPNTGAVYELNPKTGKYDIELYHGTKSAAKAEADRKTAEDDEVLARGLVDGTLGGTDLSRAKNRAGIIALAKRIDPSYTSQTYSSRKKLRDGYSGDSPQSNGGKMQSLNQLAGHLQALDDYSVALKNHDTQKLNSIINYVSTQMGGSKPTNYQTAALAVSEEVARLLKGGVAGEAEGAAWLKRFDPNASQEQQQQAIDTVSHLVHARINAMRQQWKKVMGKANEDEFEEFLEPEARERYGVTTKASEDPENPAGLDLGGVSGPSQGGVGLFGLVKPSVRR